MKRHPELFDFEKRMQELSEQKDPLEKLNFINWEMFRKHLKKIRKKVPGEAGRPPFDEILMFKILILQSLYNLSDEQTEYQIKDRLSFMRFLGLDLHDKVPDENTIRHFKDKLREHNLIKKLFERFNQFLSKQGLISKQGSIVDASIVDAPRQRNSEHENEVVKMGNVPKEWKDNPNKLAQKDTDARWLKYAGRKHFGYKNHTRVDRKSKLIQDYTVTSANVHDSKPGAELIKRAPDKIPIYADRAYDCSKINEILVDKKMKNKILKKKRKGKVLSQIQKNINRTLSKVRARVEHVYGDMEKFGGDFVRTIGIERTELRIGLINLVYNFRRSAFLLG